MSHSISSAEQAELHEQVDRVVRSRVFARAHRSQRFLRYLVDAALADPPRTTKEYVVAIDVFDRDGSYDPAIDATVRVEASRLRSRLREYYAEEGQGDAVLISVPKGGYCVSFTHRQPDAAPPSLEKVSEDPAQNLVQDPAQVRRPPLPGPHRPSNPVSRPMLRVSGASVALVAAALCLGAYAGFPLLHRASAPSPPIHSMAVLPLRNLSGDAAQEYFADATTEELITELARVPNLSVLSWSAVSHLKGSQEPLREIAAELHADAIVEGSIVRAGDDARINAAFIDARTGKTLWASSNEVKLEDTVALEDRTAQEIAARARLAMAPARPAAEIPPSNPAAREACARGANYFDKRDAVASARAFQQAIDLAPGYAPAYTGLANALVSEMLLGNAPPASTVSLAMAAAQRALALDPDSGDALIARGSIEVGFLWRWREAESDLLRGVSLSPGNSFGQMQLAVLYDSQGVVEEGVARMRHAVELDPLSFFMARHYGSTLFYARRYEEAMAQLQYARSMQPKSAPVVDWWISAVYQQQGHRDEAVHYDLLQLQQSRKDVDTEQLLAVYRRSGWSAYWLARSAQWQIDAADPCSRYQRGRVLLRAGKTGEAWRDLGEAADRHCYWTAMLPADPELDPYRANPDFAAILARLGLPAAPK